MAVSITTARRTDLIPAVAVRRLMDDAVDILPFDEVPFQNLTQSDSISNIQPEWLNEDLDRQTGTVNAASALASATIVLVDSSNVRVGDVLKLKGGTVMAKVTANVYGTNTLTVTRPFAGSTDQALAVNDVLEIVGQDLTEGQDPADPRDTDFTGDYNFSQIFEEAVQATRTSRKNTQYGTDDPYTHAEMKKYRELNVRLERAFIHGRRQKSGATRQMGGLLHYVTSNTHTGTSAQLFDLTSTAGVNSILDGLQVAYENGAKPDLLLCSPAMKRYVAGVLAGTTVFSQRTDETIGRIVNVLHTDFGDVRMEMDRQVPRRTGFVLQTEYVRRQIFDGWASEPLAKTGDTDKGMIVGEFSLKVKNPLAHFQVVSTDL